MNYKLIVCFLCFNIAALSQSTFFIKYKSHIDKEHVSSKIVSKNIFSGKDDLQQKEQIKTAPFAKGIAKDNDIFGRIIKVTFPESLSAGEIMELGNSDPDIEYIQPMLVYQLDYIPNDTLVSEQWGLEKTRAFDAWDITTGSDSVIIGIIDTGIDYLHPDLANKIYLNPGEHGADQFGNDKRFNGIDDDGNGFVDDYMGWDFTDRVGFPFDSTGGDYLDWDNDPADGHGHGTYISGIAGAETNNITGIAGAAPGIKLLNLRAFDPGGYGEEDDVAAAILYAISIGVKVINMSFGDYSFSYVLRDVIQYAYSQNIVMVASSGNTNSPDPHYPSAYPEVISVGNSTSTDAVAPQSNWGSTLDLVAPGTLIVTTARDGNYAGISGTSASAPFVSAAAALVLSLNDFTNEEVKQIIKSTTDDIGTPGWDIRSGAGRLNIFNAVNVIAPSQIKINHPRQDFATLKDTLKINATVLSPYFVRYELFYGRGYNPSAWVNLIPDGLNQFSGEDIYNLNLDQLPDSVYCLRLVVYFNNGRTMEERSNFHIIRTPPVAELVTLAPMFYGERTTIVAAAYTNTPSVMRLYFKKPGDASYNYVTLDGFNMNTQFVKQFHYGFIPPHLVEQNVLYQVFLEAENLVGLKTQIYQQGQDFLIRTDYRAEYVAVYEQPYKLPPGLMFENPVNFLSDDYNEILFSEFYTTPDLYFALYQMTDDSFIKIDSIKNKFPREAGDFNNNGKTDLLSSIGRTTLYIDEQEGTNTLNLVTKYSDSTSATDTSLYWAAAARDINNDGVTEVITFSNDTTISIYRVTPSLQLEDKKDLKNFTKQGFWFNTFDYPHVTIADLNGNGRNEIWAVDRDGDIFSYEVTAAHTYEPGIIISTEFASSTSFLDAGDFNGDGKTELAVLIRSIEQLDIAPFYRLLVFNLQNNNVNYLMDQAFIDASTEFSSRFEEAPKSIRFHDLDNDGKDELILFIFPYSYIFKEDNGIIKIIHYSENITSNTVFIGDLNNNNVPEVAFPSTQGVLFYEFGLSNRAGTPYHVNGHSIDSTIIELTWNGSGGIYYIYRGTDEQNLTIIDSVMNSEKEYLDFNVSTGLDYYYAVQAVDFFKPEPVSDLSRIIKIFSHTPGRVIKVESKSSKTVIVTFSEKISTTVENLQAFRVEGEGAPIFVNSVSPHSQYSYLLTFNRNLMADSLYRLIINGAKDIYGSPVPVYDSYFEVIRVITAEEFFVSSFELLNPYLIKITFNLDVDEATALTNENYIFNPDNRVTSVTLDPEDGRTIYLDLKGGKPVGAIGKEYRLQIINVRSSDQLSINSGAGSYIVITGFAKDLSDVYVYPNPSRGSGVTFANLPQRARITIFSLNGDQITTLEENDGNGGVEYNLMNYRGELIGSGIYFYRILRIDEGGNELEEKVGKFAVIR